jgi:hypothetical protein
MSEIRVPWSQRSPLPRPIGRLTRGGRPVLLAAVFGLSSTLALGAPLALAAPIAGPAAGSAGALAIVQPSLTLMDDHGDTFTMGVLTDAQGDTIHIQRRDGDTQGFKFDDDTVIRDEAGHRLGRDDLHEGDTVLITTSDDDDNTADLIVDGGAYGFRPGGFFDIGNRLDERGRWDWRSRGNEAQPFDPHRLGAIVRGFQRQNDAGHPGQHDYRQGDSGGGNDHGNPNPGNPRRFNWRWGR